MPFDPSRRRKGNRWHLDTRSDSSSRTGRRLTFRSATLNWKVGDTIPLGSRTLRVLRVRDDDVDTPPALVVEDAEINAA